MQELNPLMAAIGGAFTESVRKMVETHMTYLWNENANVVAALTAKVAALEAQLAAQTVPSPADLVAEVDWSEQLDYGKIVEHINLADLAGELTDSQLETVAEGIDLNDLAGKLNLSDLTGELDGALSDWFQNQSFTIKP